ncbi:cupin domain-containing protein [Variovorax sp. LT1R16]|uniref:cupin domain-containing protein n=1 Tax=Variovorax sp. LT1R16 TaxID=3443728 RepID=UPI003F450530
MSAHLRLLRIQNDLTLDQLARAAGLTRSYLSKVERGLCSPSIASALHLAKALNVTVEELFQVESAKVLSILRAPQTESASARPISGQIANGRISAFVLRPSQDRLRNPSSRHSGEEMVYVLSGQVELQLSDKMEFLNVGDCAHFDAAIPHKITSIGETEAQILVVVGPAPEVAKTRHRRMSKPMSGGRGPGGA